MLKMCNLIRGPKFRREGGGQRRLGKKPKFVAFFLKPSLIRKSEIIWGKKHIGIVKKRTF